MQTIVKPTDARLKRYYATLESLDYQGVSHEGALRDAFQRLLEDVASSKAVGWTLIAELSDRANDRGIRPDATLRDRNFLPRGYWEAKDPADKLDAEIAKKRGKGYPLSNTIFEDSLRAVLFQNGAEAFRADLSDKGRLADLLNRFFSHVQPNIEGFDKAIREFKERVPELARGLNDKIKEAHRGNARFQAAFDSFLKICRESLNPNIRVDAVDEMLIQHLLTERLIERVLENGDFARRNVIAVEVERVIDAMVSRSFSRQEFLRSLDPFYAAIEGAAATLSDYTEKQHFLNSVYEQFFQGYSVKIADTHGIVYTPQPIVDFMCASVCEALESEFGKTLGDPDVFVVDPATGTGSFVANLLRRVPKRDLPAFYKGRLFANEVMLMPYYIASLNVERTYFELTGGYEPFEGLCFVDTLDLVKGKQGGLFVTEANTRRIASEHGAPITVVLGNPPYNAHQLSENDNNKNRRYDVIDKRVRETFVKDSTATLKSKAYDPYVKFFRWAMDRLEGRDGIVCFVSNNNFVDDRTFDGVRKHLFRDFSRIYHLDLHGDVRQNPKLSGTTHNVMGIQLGVGITVAVRRAAHSETRLSYFRLPEDWRRDEKLRWLTPPRKLPG